MPCHLKTSPSFQQTDSRPVFGCKNCSRSSRSLAVSEFPLTSHRDDCLILREGGWVGEFFLCGFNLSALHIPQYRSCDPDRVGGARPERFKERSVFSHFSHSIYFLFLFVPTVCFHYHLSITQWGLSSPHILFLWRKCLLLVATKNPFVGSMISLAMTRQPWGPSASHWNSTQEVLLTGTHTWPTMRLCFCARSLL